MTEYLRWIKKRLQKFVQSQFKARQLVYENYARTKNQEKVNKISQKMQRRGFLMIAILQSRYGSEPSNTLSEQVVPL